MAKQSPSLTSDSSTSSSSSTPLPFSSPMSHSSLVPSISPRTYRSCSSPRLRVTLEFDGPGRTLQSFKEECDINTIMKRYQQTGVIDHVNRASPKFGDVEAVDFQDALNLVLDAEARFAALPSEVRERFGNDPARLLAFVDDPANRQEAVKLRLIDDLPSNVPPMPGGSQTPPAGAVAPSGGVSSPGSPSSPSIPSNPSSPGSSA